MSTWLVIASASNALIYNVSKNLHTQVHPYHPPLVHELSHEASRLRVSDLHPESVGNYKAGHLGKGAFHPHSDPHENEVVVFAKELSAFLEKEYLAHHYTKMILCAAPHFHGLLNANLSEKVKASVLEHIQKDYIPLPKDKLNDVVMDVYKRMV